jgi:hypothetical protein
MTIREAITLFGYHQKSDLKARTVQSYHPLLQRFEDRFADRPFDSIGSEEIYQFLESLTEKLSKSTRRLRVTTDLILPLYHRSRNPPYSSFYSRGRR